MEKRLMMVLVTLLMTVSMAMAQTNVSGTVVSEDDGLPVIGASVKVVGTNIGAITDMNGHFSVSLPEGKKHLRIQYVGMVGQTVTAKNGMKVVLATDNKIIDDVVVVGYGTQKREAKTGSITTVNADQIADIPASSIDKMLSGKLAGVQISQQSGQPGSSTTIRIRGISSINAGNSPLYVVDGVPVISGDDSALTNTTNVIAMLNPNDIESITVLKDAAAASVYGSRAANGVILITTKSGKEGKNDFTVRARFGFSQLANDNDFGIMSGKELLEYQRAAIVNAGRNPDDPTGGSTYYRPYELLTRPQTNWMDHFTRTGKMTEVEATMSGGSAKTKYYNSISYHKNDGIFYGIDFSRIQARVNVDHELSKNLQTGVRVNGGYMESNDTPMQSLYYSNPAFAGMTILPWTPAYDENGDFNCNIPENSNQNPRATAAYDKQNDKRFRFNGTYYLQWKPLRQLTLKTTNSIELSFNEGERYWDPKAHVGSSGYPKLQTTQDQYRQLTTSNTATWQDTYLDKHSVRLLAGQEATQYHNHEYYEYTQNLNPEIPFHSSTTDYQGIDYAEVTSSMLSFFGILDYNYDSRYYLQASIREDGSSKFGKNSRWGLFWSVGLSWNIHNESFMKNVEWLDVLKLRASYGINGNNNIANYMQYGTYTSTAYNGLNGLRPSTPSNDNLSWEKNKAWNLGVDFRFLKRFSGSIDLYTRKTTDMLLDKSQSSTSGFNSVTTNIGSMRNSGIELQLDADIIDTKDWHWSMGFNISHNKSKVLELADEEMLSYSEDSRIRHFVGERLFTFYLYDYYGVNPVNGEALWRTEDGELTNDFSKAARVKAGSPEPKFTGGVNTTLTWKDLSLSVVGEFKTGNLVYIMENSYLQSDGTQMSMNQMKAANNYWKKPGDTGCNPKPVANNASNSNNMGSTRYLEKGDYFRIKDITLSYNVPKTLINRIGVKNLRIYGSAQNIFTFHDVNFWDPERGEDGLGYGIYPVTKTMVVGLDLTF